MSFSNCNEKPNIRYHWSHSKPQPKLWISRVYLSVQQALQITQVNKTELTLLVTGFNGRK